MPRGGYRYVTRPTNPDHAGLGLRPKPSAVRTEAIWRQDVGPAPRANPLRELREAERACEDAARAYEGARARIGAANRTRLPGIAGDAGRIPAQQVRAAKRAAFRGLNRARAQLRAARARLDDARALLGLPLADADAAPLSEVLSPEIIAHARRLAAGAMQQAA